MFDYNLMKNDQRSRSSQNKRNHNNGSNTNNDNTTSMLQKIFRTQSRSPNKKLDTSSTTHQSRLFYLPPPSPASQKLPSSPSNLNPFRGISPSNISTTTSNNDNRSPSKSPRKEKKRQHKHHVKNVKRYRGFSTSISSLFLDEQVVCGAVSWCGLLASSRTEYLLNVRNESLKRKGGDGVSNDRRDEPSRILGLLLMSSVAFISLTYLIWGFGTIEDDENNNYNNDDDYVVQNQYYGRMMMTSDNNTTYYYDHQNYMDYEHHILASKHYVPAVMRISDYDRRFWAPFNALLWKMVKPPSSLSSSTYHNGSRNLYSWVDDQDLAYNLRWIVCLIFLFALGLFGRSRRMKTRFAVLKARENDDRVNFGGGLLKKESMMKSEDKYSGACSHTLCGCYPIDRRVKMKGNTDNEIEDDVIAPGVQKSNTDCFNSSFNVFMSCCCGKICKLWCQCFSICALAQEAREVRLLIPPKSQRIDFITHQPWNDYFRNIYALRLSWKEKSKGVRRSWNSHFEALSSLSRSILITFIISTVVIIITEQLNPRAMFTWADACILILTFLQSFVVLGIVHGIFHKSDLSFDAVIKFFAAGFVIAAPTAFVFEYIFMSILALFYYIIVAVITLFDEAIGKNVGDIDYQTLIFFDILQSYLIAALIEEACKYYAFRTVEHPDLIFLTGLNRVKHDKMTTYGGNAAYAFSSDNNAKISRTDSFESEYSNTTHKSHRGNSLTPSKRLRNMLNKNSDDQDVRTARQKAAAVTTAMISGAVGLACAENFIYVFFFSGSNTQDEIGMLLFRSIFPVHAFCAAMQSIGVIEKFLEEIDENSSSIGVGSILLPAILLHGSFDAILMTVNSIIDNTVENSGGVGYDFTVLNIIAGSLVIGVVLFGLIWYYVKNRSQKARLKLLETSPPRSKTIPEIEIV